MLPNFSEQEYYSDFVILLDCKLFRTLFSFLYIIQFTLSPLRISGVVNKKILSSYYKQIHLDHVTENMNQLCAIPDLKVYV